MRFLYCLAALLGTSFAATVKHDASFSPDFVLVATLQLLEVGCSTRNSVVFNGTSPGPRLTLREGKTTWVRVYNNIPADNLTVHWHGLSQRTAPFSDGTPLVSQWPIAPGRYFDYEIRPEVGDAGTYFYHSHFGFQQLTAHGALIVKDVKDSPYDYDQERTLLFGDYYAKDDATIVSGLLGDPFKWSGEPNAVLVNGKSGVNTLNATSGAASCAPAVITVEPGKQYRIRAIGATGLSFVKAAIEGHSNLTAIEADGHYVQKARIDHIQVAPGQRFSYLLKTKSLSELKKLKKTDFWIRYESRDRPTSITGYALLRYKMPNQKASKVPQIPIIPPVGVPVDTRTYLEGNLQSLSAKVRKQFPRLSQVTRTVTIQMNQVLTTGTYTNGTLNGSIIWAQNNVPWKEHTQSLLPNAPYLIELYKTGNGPDYQAALQNRGLDPKSNTYPARIGEVLDIVWQNNAGFSGGFDFHPMHIHGEHAWDLGSGNGTYNAAEVDARFDAYTPTKRDTTVLYRFANKSAPATTMGWRAWRVKVTKQNVGAWMMHCHIAQHAIMGMNTVWVFGTAQDIMKKFPAAPYIEGYLDFGGDAYGTNKKAAVVNHYFAGKDDDGEGDLDYDDVKG
ncbi:Multicopper oxidase-like protein 2 [Elsinoe fawcettii]|nr:Multicopper oxidase-like protein 2 [Elsinoe fawcettii]